MTDAGRAAAEALIDSLDEPRRAQVRRLHEVILAALPGIDVEVQPYTGSAGIGYGWFDYSTSRGPAGRTPALGLASRKRYIALHSLATAGGRYLVEAWRADRFSGTKGGRSCLNITRPERVSDAAVADLARATWEQFREHLSPQPVLRQERAGGRAAGRQARR